MVRQRSATCGYLYLSVSIPVQDNDRVAAAGIQRTLVTKAQRNSQPFPFTQRT